MSVKGHILIVPANFIKGEKKYCRYTCAYGHLLSSPLIFFARSSFFLSFLHAHSYIRIYISIRVWNQEKSKSTKVCLTLMHVKTIIIELDWFYLHIETVDIASCFCIWSIFYVKSPFFINRVNIVLHLLADSLDTSRIVHVWMKIEAVILLRSKVGFFFDYRVEEKQVRKRIENTLFDCK